VTEIYGKSIAELRKKTVDYIYSNGDLVIDQREEKTKECRYLHLILTGKNRLGAEKGLTEVLDKDFADGLIKDDVAKQKGEAFDYAYGWQIRKNDMLNKTIELLKGQPETRRAYIPVFHPDNVYSSLEVPCCVGIYILIRDEALELTTVFRSNEMFIAAMTDIKGYCDFQEWLAKKLGYELGDYHQFVMSAHLRMSDLDGIKKLLGMV
jgi:thymidylate synthase